MRESYIGVTGFMTKEEVDAAIVVLDGLPSWSPRVLMVGVLANSKTLAGMTNNRPTRYPLVCDIAKLFPLHPRTVNLIHYATDDPESLPVQLEQLKDIGGRHLDGFQLNMVWPVPQFLTSIHGMRVVLQISRRAMEAFNNNPGLVAKQLDGYTGIVTDVLVDTSGGHGIPMDPAVADAYVRAISTRHPYLGIGVAGGLSRDQMWRLQPLADKFPRLNVDAEGRLRTHDDHLNIKAMQEYISCADGLFSP